MKTKSILLLMLTLSLSLPFALAQNTVNVDSGNTNTGTELPGLEFGTPTSGEVISSARTSGSTNRYGLDFWTDFGRRMSITQAGNVGIDEANPAAALHINGPASTPPGGLNAGDNGLLLGTAGNESYKWIQSYGGVLAINPVGNYVGIGTATPVHHLDMGDGAYEQSGQWFPNSDRNLKENLRPVEGRDVLTRLNKIPILTWNFKIDDPSVRHLGPMAQDFYAAFGLNGKDDKHIGPIDEGGVALAAIQELYRMIVKKDKEVGSLAEANHEKDVQIQQLTVEVDRLQNLEQAVQILSTKLSNIETGATSTKVLRASR